MKKTTYVILGYFLGVLTVVVLILFHEHNLLISESEKEALVISNLENMTPIGTYDLDEYDTRYRINNQYAILEKDGKWILASNPAELVEARYIYMEVNMDDKFSRLVGVSDKYMFFENGFKFVFFKNGEEQGAIFELPKEEQVFLEWSLVTDI